MRSLFGHQKTLSLSSRKRRPFTLPDHQIPGNRNNEPPRRADLPLRPLQLPEGKDWQRQHMLTARCWSAGTRECSHGAASLAVPPVWFSHTLIGSWHNPSALAVCPKTGSSERVVRSFVEVVLFNISRWNGGIFRWVFWFVKRKCLLENEVGKFFRIRAAYVWLF